MPVRAGEPERPCVRPLSRALNRALCAMCGHPRRHPRRKKKKTGGKGSKKNPSPSDSKRQRWLAPRAGGPIRTPCRALRPRGLSLRCRCHASTPAVLRVLCCAGVSRFVSAACLLTGASLWAMAPDGNAVQSCARARCTATGDQGAPASLVLDLDPVVWILRCFYNAEHGMGSASEM